MILTYRASAYCCPYGKSITRCTDKPRPATLKSTEGAISTPLPLKNFIVKFTLVVLWFMHLKFDNKLYARFFTGGIFFALTVYAIVLLTLRVFQN